MKWYGERVDELDAIAARIVARDRGGARGPWTLELYPTLLCNLSCGFCDSTVRHQRPVGELGAARMLALVSEAAALGARRVMILGGGEPLLAPHTVEVMRRAKELGLSGMLTTNGTLLGPTTVDAIVAMVWDEVHISVDGARPRTHDRLRGQAGAFARTIRNVCRLRAARDAAGHGPRLSLHTVLTRENLDELPGIIRLAAALGAEAVEVDALVAYRPEQLVHALGPEELARLPLRVQEGLEEAARLGVRTTLSRLLKPEALQRGERAAPSPLAAAREGYHAAPCLKAWHHLTISADGRVAPCCVLAGSGGSVADRPLAEVWEGDPFLTQVREGMLAGAPQARCAECSENLLDHERAILARLPEAARA
ncbi:heme d1 biosynthesis radical SAM protein NirJ2 [Deltaproteobacteria bacterium]|nr:heme d1 biosynthesis radical SAM protein NirJ2 [Deltaproteobacteria bacterium]